MKSLLPNWANEYRPQGVELSRGRDDHELRRRPLEPAEQVSHHRDRDVLEVGISAGVRRHLGDEELVVDVAVEPEALGLDSRDRLPRERDRDRLVQEELSRRRLDDGGALVTDQRLFDTGCLRVRQHRAEHASRRDQHVDAGRLGGSNRCERPRAQDTVLGDQRPVEVAGDRGDAAREVGRKDQVSRSSRRRTARRRRFPARSAGPRTTASRRGRW